MIKVMIADDQELIRQSLEIVLSTKPDLEVVSTVAVLKCWKASKNAVRTLS